MTTETLVFVSEFLILCQLKGQNMWQVAIKCVLILLLIPLSNQTLLFCFEIFKYEYEISDGENDNLA